MKVLVDTCIWSDALRKSVYNKNKPVVKELRELITEGRIQMVGPVRQELLSGIKSKEQFNQLKFYLKRFPDLNLTSKDFEKAAEIFNLNRKKGVQGSNTDFLICALSINHGFPVFTINKDFEKFNENSPIFLHQIREF